MGANAPPEVQRLARAGNYGETTNTARDVQRAFQTEVDKVGLVPEVFEFKVPMLRRANELASGTELVSSYMLLPHEYLGIERKLPTLVWR
jgi:hypothetical protein